MGTVGRTFITTWVFPSAAAVLGCIMTLVTFGRAYGAAEEKAIALKIISDDHERRLRSMETVVAETGTDLKWIRERMNGATVTDSKKIDDALDRLDHWIKEHK